jgi:aspartyl-tRNA(Asn)/glutamyl-tRNA(Gln) amidotransferase subunit C
MGNKFNKCNCKDKICLKSFIYDKIKILFRRKIMISTDDVKHVAKLARLELTEDEINKYSKQLGDILKYVEKMNEVDTTGVEPMPHAIPVYNVMREDVVKYEETKEELMANAPFEEDGFFRVPKIN